MLACAGVAAPLCASANSAASDYFAGRTSRGAVPALLTPDERAYYRDLFGAIDRSDWPRVQAMFAQRDDGPLHQSARAEYFLSANSPKIEADGLTAWLAGGTQLPQAEQIGRLAQ